MYPNYFGLKEASFAITPDPHYLFLSEQHREALAHLLYGASENGGFVLLTGEVGTGKTTVCRAFLEQLPPAVEVALVLNPALTAIELMHAICDEFGITVPAGAASAKTLLDRLNAFLLAAHAQGRHPVLIIDEAQNLRPKVLEQVRLLTNLETAKAKLLQIFLIGQPELRTMLASADLRQLNQRITARFHLRPLDAAATAAYIEHRISVAGVDRPLFTAKALRAVHRHSGGVPRLINLICDRALLGAAVSRRIQVTPDIVHRAAREVQGERGMPPGRLPRALAMAAAVLLAAGLGMWVGASGQLHALGERLAALGQPAPAAQVPTAAIGPTTAAPAPAPTAVEPVLSIAMVQVDPAPASPPTVVLPEPAPPTLATAEPNPPERADPPAVAAPQEGVPQETVPLAEVQTPPTTAIPPPPAEASAPAATDTATSADPPVPALAPASAAVEVQPAAPPAAPMAAAPAPAPSPPQDPPAPAATPQAPSGPPAPGDDTPRIAVARLAPDVSDLDPARLASITLAAGDAVPALLRAWDLTAPAGVGCNGVRALGLACERASGRWSDLRRYDRPAALRLQLDGRQRYVLVTGLDEEFARCTQGEQTWRVPVASLDEHWSGDFLMLWRPPLEGVRHIGGSASGTAVQWLRERLAALPDAGLTASGPAHFDAALSSAVRRFQTAQGLSADGVAGPRTLILLDNALATGDVPRLGQHP